ncbi:FecCD family ABC transporter permease [Beijerinckia indica]|uniref:Transport system permease protein n=1 Tax=Beijerinckia indica subsp. indica (strain ATCC 9039 / DSM 1715 / NCIMB 8712) TaxID=395963 RepID=B2IHF7_BEII9|nr:iron ABC transporter permease [Beijerinckia indica]ACB95942.1 transport system permease protein [Beijerinckia indica subsp. indica ATCC 9039]
MSTLSYTDVPARRERTWHAPLLVILLGLTIAIALTIGRYPLSLSDLLDFSLASLRVKTIAATRYDLLYNVIVEIRLPRVLAAGLIGAALSISGGAYQAVFRNPLVSPGIMGVLAGASFGAALGMLVASQWFLVQVLAFAFGLGAVALGVIIANLFGPATMITLILGGMISGAFFTAALSIVKYTADPYDQLPAIVYWLMGHLGGIELRDVGVLTPFVLIGCAILSMFGRGLDALAMGEDEARSLGVPVFVLRYGVIAVATFVSSISVSFAGMIGWIGLVVPHFARVVVGPGNARLLPASACMGAIFLIIADGFARNLWRAEIPVGIMTELFGIPAFLLVIYRARKGWA